MKLRFAVVALTLSLSSVAVHAQGALYLTPVAVRVSNSTVDNGLFSFLGPNQTSRMFYGVNFGGFYDLPSKQKQYEIGIDVRDSITHGNNASLNSFLIGPRVAVSPFTHPIHPYLEPVVGLGTSRAPNTAVRVNKVQFGIFAGADYEFSRRVTFRAIEVGYSSLATASSETIGGSAVIPSANLLSITTGLTFRLP
jgi:hypothetical protein